VQWHDLISASKAPKGGDGIYPLDFFLLARHGWKFVKSLVFISQSRPVPGCGGGETYVADILQSLAAASWQITVLLLFPEANRWGFFRIPPPVPGIRYRLPFSLGWTGLLWSPVVCLTSLV